ncbi:uncharacterized protein A4U43_C06F19900 [Asparagus officinalis]|uniref:RING-type E3 ubiquitin transferase n=1 Tax=Asparagus officinalis TaxID=4686 RepID=A0A5P1EN94_ASPOF|nr:E3 ubiquitin-protein ligase At3g02290-like [Asparagus officinalis]ONK67406.1 uncharacterized protein A4U43_C06F19900 [Asparagus officinalis]
MGCAFSCFHADDEDDDDHDRQSPEPPVLRNCVCSALTQQLYYVLFQRAYVSDTSSSVQETTSRSGVAEDRSISDSYRPPPRPLAYDDPRCSRSNCQHTGLISRGEKASSHVHEETERLRGRNSTTEYLGIGNKLNASDNDKLSKLCLSESSLKFPSQEVTSGAMYIFSSSEDEDVCPTCLEEYTVENPRIMMQCSHHFHLSCIYEWMERSEACPVCGKVMLFSETN